MADNYYQSSADTGSGDTGINLDSHVTGNPIPGPSKSGAPTIGHTWLIIAAGLALLWLFGGVFFKSIRMG